MFETITANAKGWVNQPFATSMSARRWALFLGFIIIVIIGWNLILHDAVEVVGEVV